MNMVKQDILSPATSHNTLRTILLNNILLVTIIGLLLVNNATTCAPRSARQPRRAPSTQEDTLFENQLSAYLHNQKSALAGSAKLIRQYQLSKEATMRDPAQADRYHTYRAEILAAEKEKFNNDLKRYRNNDVTMTIPELKSRWSAPSQRADEQIKQRSHGYLQQINHAHAIKTGLSPDIIDIRAD